MVLAFQSASVMLSTPHDFWRGRVSSQGPAKFSTLLEAVVLSNYVEGFVPLKERV